MNVRPAHLLSIGLLAASALLAGCGNVISSSCNESIQCEGGNDMDIDACIASSEGAQNVAAAYGCSEAFDKLLDCIDTTSKCSKGHYSSDCGDEAEAVASCEKAASSK
ncbi:MAG: hypothetical protein U0359_13980 [Byssovorax sp.]